MRSAGAKTCLTLVLAALASGPAVAQTTAILIEADRKIGDKRHQLSLVNGQQRITIACRTDERNAFSSAIQFAPNQDWPSGPNAIELTRDDGAVRTLSFSGSLDLLTGSAGPTWELAAWGLASRELSLRSADGRSATFDLRPPQTVSTLARFKNLCQF